MLYLILSYYLIYRKKTFRISFQSLLEGLSFNFVIGQDKDFVIIIGQCKKLG